jgi:hypothetical protein
MARLQIAWLEADRATKEQMRATLEPLLAADNPFRFAASEVMAYVALRFGERDEALAAYDRLGKERGAPQAMRQRAASLATYLRANPTVRTLPLSIALPAFPSAPAPAGSVSSPVDEHGHPRDPAPATPSPPTPAPAPAPVPETQP